MRDLPEHAVDRQLRISQVQGVRVRVLRLWRPDARLLKRLNKVFGSDLPVAPNATAGERVRLLWTGPGEWTVLGCAPRLEQDLAAACAEALHHLADVTEGRAILTIEGPAAPDLLAKGCSLDFHPRVFRAGTCAQSPLAQLRVLIERPTEAPLFNLIVDRTQLAHLQAWLDVAGAEFLGPEA